MLIPDGRQCTQTVNDLLAATQAERHGPRFDREVEYYPLAHVFGHFDSRGGSTLLLGYASTPAAILAYEAMCGFDQPEWDAGYQDLQEGEGKIHLVVCDQPLPPDGELLAGYTWDDEDPGYLMARLESRYQCHDGTQSDWDKTHTRVLYRDTRTEDQREEDDRRESDEDYLPACAPTILPETQRGLQFEYRLVHTDPGEDACGLVLARREQLETNPG